MVFSTNCQGLNRKNAKGFLLKENFINTAKPRTNSRNNRNESLHLVGMELKGKLGSKLKAISREKFSNKIHLH